MQYCESISRLQVPKTVVFTTAKDLTGKVARKSVLARLGQGL